MGEDRLLEKQVSREPETAERFKTHDGIELYEISDSPAGSARAVVVLLHGLRDHSGRFPKAVAFLTRLGYAVEAFDLRGHGRSGGIRCSIESFEEYLKDLDVFLNRVRGRRPRVPVFFLGIGTGGTIALMFILTRRPNIRGLILTAPGLKFRGRGGGGIHGLFGRAKKSFPPFHPGPPDASVLSREPGDAERWDSDPHLFQGKIPPRTCDEFRRAGRIILERREDISLPVLVLQGTADRLVDPEGGRRLIDGIGSADKQLCLLNGFSHDILNEPENFSALEEIDRWISGHIRSSDR